MPHPSGDINVRRSLPFGGGALLSGKAWQRRSGQRRVSRTGMATKRLSIYERSRAYLGRQCERPRLRNVSGEPKTGLAPTGRTLHTLPGA
jgi:hypothetical protein